VILVLELLCPFYCTATLFECQSSLLLVLPDCVKRMRLNPPLMRVHLPQETSSSAMGVPPDKLAAEEASFQRAQRLAQVKQADRNLMAARAAAAILKSKLKTATEREEYIMSTLRGLAAELLCKPLNEPPSPYCTVLSPDELA
jgi:hypothetical protein